MLTVSDHRRDSAGLIYVYPVVSRRSGGLSIGVNLNPNNACNWRCVYCQVPGLQRGSAPEIDLALLRRELEQVLTDILTGEFYSRFGIRPEQRGIRDIAISGNGEATTAKDFPAVIALIGDCYRRFGLAGSSKLVLISNGSRVRQSSVREGLRQWNRLGGELWFKLDSATAPGIERINGVRLSPSSVLANLEIAAALCPVWLQTCVFSVDHQAPDAAERTAYLKLLVSALERGIGLQGVLLYGLARPSQQPEAARLSALPAEWLETFAGEIAQLGLTVRVNP